MDSSKPIGGIEEFSSSESGWTMYIASPMHHHDDSDENAEEEEDVIDDDGDDSDDSLASDASSGPNNHENPCGNDQGGHDMTHFKPNEGNSKYYAYKKGFKTLEKKRDEVRRKENDKDESVLKASSVISPVLSVAKVGKNSYMAKAK